MEERFGSLDVVKQAKPGIREEEEEEEEPISPPDSESTRAWVLLLGTSAWCEGLKLRRQIAENLEDAIAQVRRLGPRLACVVSTDPRIFPELQKPAFRAVFGIAVGEALATEPLQRLRCFDQGARMLASDAAQVEKGLERVAKVLQDKGSLCCPGCGLEGLSENALHLHMHFHHAVDVVPDDPCPVCRKKVSNLPVHVHNGHGPPEAREPDRAPYATFAWCVCRRHDGCFLMVNEPAGISGGQPRFWLPAGRVDRGESLREACEREALEEAGVEVRVTGILRLMVSSGTLRALFLAEPKEPDATPKSVPDWESAGAMWVDVKELKKLKASDYRHPDPATLYPKVASGELVPHEVDTKAFQALETLIRRLTMGDASAMEELNPVWRKVEKTYPRSVFKD